LVILICGKGWKRIVLKNKKYIVGRYYFSLSLEDRESGATFNEPNEFLLEVGLL
jgi:hypothetical protein